jgi:nucleotide-binding universal stress UspA family protein
MLDPDLDATVPHARGHAEYVPPAERIDLVVALRVPDAHPEVLDWVASHVGDDPLEVQLVTVLEPGEDRTTALEKTLGALTESMQALQERRPALRVHVKVREGDVVDSLLACPGGFLVVGGERHPGGRSDGESLAIRLATRAQRPVVVVPAGWRPREDDEIVVAVAPDLATDSAIDFAARATSGRAIPLRLVHVTPEGEESDPTLLLEQSEIRARQQGAAEVRVERRHGPVDVALAEAAAHAHLLVLGRPRRSELGRRVFGSVGRRVLGRATVPAAIVPVDERIGS